MFVGKMWEATRVHIRPTTPKPTPLDQLPRSAARDILAAMLPTPETKPTELADMLARLEDRMRRMQDDLDSRLDAIAESLDACGADGEDETLAAERIRSGAATRTQDGAEALAELGIHTR
jgi:hypothetical protein